MSESTEDVCELKQLPFQQRKRWLAELALLKCKNRLDRGHVVARSNKLHSIRSLFLSDGTHVTEEDSICSAIGKFFERNWGCVNLQTRASALDFIRKAEGMVPKVDAHTLEIAFARIKKKQVLDHAL